MHQQPHSTIQGTIQSTPPAAEGEQHSLSAMTAPHTLSPWMERMGHVTSMLDELQEGRSSWTAQLNMMDEAGVATEAVREQVDAHLAKESNIRLIVENNLDVLGKFGALPAESLKAIGLDSHVSQMVYSLQCHTAEFSDEQQALELIFNAR